MKRPTILLCLPLLLMACDQPQTGPTETPDLPELIPAPFPTPTVRAIQVGEEVKGVFMGVGQIFEFTAPAKWSPGRPIDLEHLGHRNNTGPRTARRRRIYADASALDPCGRDVERQSRSDLPTHDRSHSELLRLQ